MSDGIPLPLERVHIELTSRCNFDCSFCPQGSLTRKLGTMPFALYQKIIEQIAAGEIAREVHFHLMGEPLLYPQIEEAISLAATLGLITVVTTNGSLLTEERTETLTASGLSKLIVSVQTPNEETFAIRNASGVRYEEYERRLLTAARKILAAETTTRLVLTFRTTAYPFLQAPGSRIRLIDTNGDLHEILESFAQQCLPDASQVDLRSLCRQAIVSHWNTIELSPRFSLESRPLGGWVKPENGRRFFPARIGTCHALSEMFGILANGDLVFCCMDANGKTAVGNAETMPILDFFQNETVLAAWQGFRGNRVVHKACRQCLGEPGLIPSIGHQLGSILYLKFFRNRSRRLIRNES